MVIAFIVAAEIAFWVILLAGLAARYGLGRPKLGMALLVATPFVDLALLAATTIDLRRGGEAALPHALAAVYIGVSVAWGRRIVGMGRRPLRAPLRRRPAAPASSAHGPAARGPRAARMASSPRCLGDWDVAARSRRPRRRRPRPNRALLDLAALWTLVLVIDFLISFSYTLSPRRPRRT